MGNLNVADYINEVNDGKTQRALQALFETIISEIDSDETGWADIRGNDIHLKSMGPGALGPTVKLEHDSVSPANSDVIARIAWYSDDDGGTSTNMAKIDAVMADVGAASEDISLDFHTIIASSLTKVLGIANGLTLPAAHANAISITGANTTAAINISAAEAVGISINTSSPTSGLLISSDCETAAINLTGAEVLGILIATSTPTIGLSITSACETAGVSIAGDCVTGVIIGAQTTAGITIAATTKGIDITGACSDTAIEISGTATNFGIDISAAQTAAGISVAGTCGSDGIVISGACTTSALHISGDQAVAILVDVDGALTTGISFAVDTAITMGTGISMVCTGTGTITTAISLTYTNSATTGLYMDVADAKVLTAGIRLDGAGTYTDGILLDADVFVDGLHISGTATTTAINISGAQSIGMTIAATSLDDGILISGTTPTDGIHISSACSGYAINITGDNTGRALSIGTKATAGASLPINSLGGFEIEPGNNYLFGLFTAVEVDQTNHLDELRSAWIRTRVNDGAHIGNVASTPSGFGVCGAEIQLKFYATSAATNTRGWQNSAVWAQLETQGTSTVSFNNGTLSSAVLANVGLTNTTVIDNGAIVAGLAVNSTTSATGGHVTTTGDFLGIHIGKSSSALSWETAIMIADSCTATGIDIGICTTGINVTGACTTAINVSAVQTASAGTEIGCVFQHGAYSTPLVYGTQSANLVLKQTCITADTGAYYVFGDIHRITTSDDSTGYMNCSYDYLSVGHNLVNGWATRGRVALTATCQVGEMAGLLGTCEVAAAAAITVTGGAVLAACILDLDINATASVAQEVTCLEVRPHIRGNIVGSSAGIRINVNCSSTNYLDFGLDIRSMSAQQTAAIRIFATPNAAALACGIHIEGDDTTSSTITNAISLVGTITNVLHFDETNGSQAGCTVGTYSSGYDETPIACFKVDMNGTAGYVYIHETIIGVS